MTHAERTHWLTVLIIALSTGLLAYGVLFSATPAMLVSCFMSSATLIAMKKGWLPRYQRRGRE